MDQSWLKLLGLRYRIMCIHLIKKKPVLRWANLLFLEKRERATVIPQKQLNENWLRRAPGKNLQTSWYSLWVLDGLTPSPPNPTDECEGIEDSNEIMDQNKNVTTRSQRNANTYAHDVFPMQSICILSLQDIYTSRYISSPTFMTSLLQWIIIRSKLCRPWDTCSFNLLLLSMACPVEIIKRLATNKDKFNVCVTIVLVDGLVVTIFKLEYSF